MLDLKDIKDEKFFLTIATPEVVSNLVVIHYGNFKYSPRKFKNIGNKNWNKPSGGLWTSPVDSTSSWKHFCDSEQFRECEEENSFKLKFKYGTKIAIINSVKDLDNMPLQKVEQETPLNKFSRFLFKNIDFELLVKIGVDAIWLTNEGQWQTRFSQPINLYGWDCETVLIMNKKCVYEQISRKVIFEKSKNNLNNEKKITYKKRVSRVKKRNKTNSRQT